MGTWGPAIFSNDTAPDVREDFRDLVAKGATPAEATEQILAEYGVGMPGDPDNNDLWLGLAAMQHKTGHVVPEVIDRALAIVETLQELERWGHGDRKARFRALTKLGEMPADAASPAPQASTPVRCHHGSPDRPASALQTQ